MLFVPFDVLCNVKSRVGCVAFPCKGETVVYYAVSTITVVLEW